MRVRQRVVGCVTLAFVLVGCGSDDDEREPPVDQAGGSSSRVSGGAASKLIGLGGAFATSAGVTGGTWAQGGGNSAGRDAVSVAGTSPGGAAATGNAVTTPNNPNAGGWATAGSPTAIGGTTTVFPAQAGQPNPPIAGSSGMGGATGNSSAPVPTAGTQMATSNAIGGASNHAGRAGQSATSGGVAGVQFLWSAGTAGSATDPHVGGMAGLGGAAGAGGTAGMNNNAAGAAGIGNESSLPEPYATAGFIELESHEYSYSRTGTLSDTTDYVASSAKLFFSFLPADRNPKSAPVFVFFNGGPGSTTTGWLRLHGTAPFTLSVDSASSEPSLNPSAWTSLGNLLYIDSRQAGFSYSTLQSPNDATARSREFTVKNFNSYLDAGDFIRVVLRFIAQQPALQNNPIVLVAESYGGMRASVMLNCLQHPSKLLSRGTWHYADQSLADEIRAHYHSVYPSEEPTRIEGALAARQFGWQVLIQPAIAWMYQSGKSPCNSKYGVLARMNELGLSCPPANPDAYDWSKPSGWTDSLAAAAQQALETVSTFTQLIGIDPRSIPGFAASQRTGAFRGTDLQNVPADLTSFTNALGPLPSYDRYYVALNSPAGGPFEISGTPSAYGGLHFFENLLHTNTLITRALLDPVVVSDRIPEMLLEYKTLMTAPPISDVQTDLSPRSGITRPGWFTVTYSGAAYGVAAGTARTVRFPTYRNAGHMVAASSPAEFYADVKDFLGPLLQ